MRHDLNGARLVAREYRRLSDAKGGTSLQRQGLNNGQAAAENDWDLGEPYIDDGLSASRFARKRRDDFEQLVADLQSGPTGRDSRFGAEILVLWESSRGSRRVGEWVSLIELLEDKGVRIWVTTHERMYDPRNGRDRKSLLEDAVDSEYESYKTHKRVTGTAAVEASKGRPHGWPPDGLMAVYDEKTGRLLTWVENPERSQIPKQLFELLEAGHSLLSIAGRFRRAGYLNLSGKPFSREHLRDMALRHAYAGLRYHRGTVYDGVWDGIVSTKRFWAVQKILNNPARKTTRDGRAKHELTAGLKCGRCGGPMAVNTKLGQLVYRCQKGCVHIQKAPVDDLIIGRHRDLGVLLEYLARDDIYEILRAPASGDAAVQAVQACLAKARAERDEMRDHKGATLAEVLVLANSLQAKEAEVAELEAREREMTLPASVLSIVKPGVDVWASWTRAPLAARRSTVRLIMTPRYLGTPYILPSPRMGPNQPVVERISWTKPAALAALEAAASSRDA
ncbi:recombinase family protein [Streptomyces chartreusis]|uniref:recombinase family protein n=1 Tax=Streptomyces chartreusis TaxID=1969 RepID=UPI003869FD00|nr:recombinase family protein [Streptomyces chartreusis]